MINIVIFNIPTIMNGIRMTLAAGAVALGLAGPAQGETVKQNTAEATELCLGAHARSNEIDNFGSKELHQALAACVSFAEKYPDIAQDLEKRGRIMIEGPHETSFMYDLTTAPKDAETKKAINEKGGGAYNGGLLAGAPLKEEILNDMSNLVSLVEAIPQIDLDALRQDQYSGILPLMAEQTVVRRDFKLRISVLMILGIIGFIGGPLLATIESIRRSRKKA